MSIVEAKPNISVLMSVHNGRKYLVEAVESILNQTFRDFEFIIVDDGSSDGSTEILKYYAGRDSRVRLIIQENQGLTKSLNTALGIARGEYIARMDADDISRLDRFANQLSFLRAHPEVVCVGAEVELVTEDGIRLGVRNHPNGHESIRRRLLLGDGGAMTHPVILFRREIALKIGGYDENFTTTQDLDFYLRLSEVGFLENLPEILLDWRQHPRSVNRTQSDTWRLMKTLAVEKTIVRIGGAAYAAQLFKGEGTFNFASDRIELAKFACKNQRKREAIELLSSVVRTGPKRRDAFKNMCKIYLIIFISFFKKYI